MKQLVHSLQIDAQTFVAYLAQVGQSFSVSAARVDGRQASGKKSRSVSGSSNAVATIDGDAQVGQLAGLSVLLENVDASKLEPAVALLSALLEMLGALVELNISRQIDVAYQAQLLMTVTTSIASRLAVGRACCLCLRLR